MEFKLNTNTLRPLSGAGRKLFVETYGCQMNVGDTEVVVALMQREGYVYTEDIGQADVILINTCSIRDNAEQRIWGRLAEMKRYRRANPGLVVGVIGCMAERLREKLVEGPAGVDVVAGPDAYRDLPRLVREAEAGGKGVNVLLSTEETYAEIAPVRLDRNGVSAFVAIMRGCDNFCSYCVVPYTRGRERSRDAETIVAEARSLFENGYREVTLLGQNVNSYRTGDVDFPELVRRVASVSPLLRVRFATSHPKDMSDGLLEVMASMPNVCRAIHLPAQSGATSMLGRMNRKYTREWYLDRIAAIRRYLPDCAITTDLIAGFSGETEEEHLQTLSLMREVGYDFAYMFKYSERPGTFAEKHLGDDVPCKTSWAMRATCATWGASSKCWSRASRSATGTSCRAALRRTRWWFSTAGIIGSATMCGSVSRAARRPRYSEMSFPDRAIKSEKLRIKNFCFMRFDELDLEDEILDGLEDMNFHEMTPVQEHTIPVILEGRDIIGCAQTGTGKTAAYTLPLLNKLLIEGNPDNVVKSLIIVPTRELAQQIDQQFQGFSYYAPLSTTVVYGGGDGRGWEQQKQGMLRGADVVIATPGRLIAHLQNSGVDLSHVKYFVLDEADRMLDMGFFDDIMTIVRRLPAERQTLMFSATLPPKIREWAKQILEKPVEINIAVSKHQEAIEQGSYVLYKTQKLGLIKELFAKPLESKTIIFSSSKLKVKELAFAFKRMHLNAAAMHSDLDQAKREEVMLDFKNGKIDLLVATDIVARGIDIEDIGMVVNYDVPHDPEDYIHRIGRTARAAASGAAMTFVSEEEQGKFHQIEKFIERDIRKAELPESVGEGPKYAPDENRGRFGRGRGGRSGGGRSGSGRGRGGRGDRSGRNDRDRRSERPAAATAAAAAEPAAAQPASPDSDHASGRGEGNRGTRDRRRHRGGRNRGRGNKPQGGEPTPQA